MNERHEFLSEIADFFEVKEEPDGGAMFYIHVPPRFASLALTKLDELTVTDAEIAEHEYETLSDDEPSEA